MRRPKLKLKERWSNAKFWLKPKNVRTQMQLNRVKRFYLEKLKESGIGWVFLSEQGKRVFADHAGKIFHEKHVDKYLRSIFEKKQELLTDLKPKSWTQYDEKCKMYGIQLCKHLIQQGRAKNMVEAKAVLKNDMKAVLDKFKTRDRQIRTLLEKEKNRKYGKISEEEYKKLSSLNDVIAHVIITRNTAYFDILANNILESLNK